MVRCKESLRERLQSFAFGERWISCNERNSRDIIWSAFTGAGRQNNSSYRLWVRCGKKACNSSPIGVPHHNGMSTCELLNNFGCIIGHVLQ